jgi:hypothetical protein
MLTILERLLNAVSNRHPAAATDMPRLTGYPLGRYPPHRRRQGPRRRRAPQRVQPRDLI